MTFTYNDHPNFGDLAVEIAAKTLNDCFADAARAIFNAMVETKSIDPKKTKTITLTAPTQKELLFNFIEELIFLKDAESFIGKDLTVKVKEKQAGKETQVTLTAKLQGETINITKHELKTDVKAITLHNFKLEQQGKNWHAEFVCDL